MIGFIISVFIIIVVIINENHDKKLVIESEDNKENIDYKENIPFLKNVKPLASAVEKSYFSSFKVIKIYSSQVSGTGSHTNFPFSVSISDADLQSECQADGDDIAFFEGETQLDHEIDYFNKTTGDLKVWVRIPSLSKTVDTRILMYFGNSTMSSQQNPTGVWESAYQGVWHLSETPSNSAIDSTSKGNDGTPVGMDASHQVAGQIGGSIKFQGDGDYISIPDANSLNITNDITIDFGFIPLMLYSQA